MEGHGSHPKISLFVSSEDYFSEMVDVALDERKVKAALPVKNYLVELLQFYLEARNLFEEESVDESGRRRPQTLAELYLTAHQSEFPQKVEMLKKMADRSLYISGFFSDSLQRKIVDVDYYVEMGRSAYGSLAHCARGDSKVQIYKTFAQRFGDFVDVLSHFSQKAQLQSNQNILRLYDRYLRTGSALDREKLTEMGIPISRQDQKRKPSLT
jgi:hypothetical protein